MQHPGTTYAASRPDSRQICVGSELMSGLPVPRYQTPSGAAVGDRSISPSPRLVTGVEAVICEITHAPNWDGSAFRRQRSFPADGHGYSGTWRLYRADPSWCRRKGDGRRLSACGLSRATPSASCHPPDRPARRGEVFRTVHWLGRWSTVRSSPRRV